MGGRSGQQEEVAAYRKVLKELRSSARAGAGARQESRTRTGSILQGKTIMRSWLYWLARLLGDIEAVRRGRVGKRIARRLAGRVVGRALWRWLR